MALRPFNLLELEKFTSLILSIPYFFMRLEVPCPSRPYGYYPLTSGRLVYLCPMLKVGIYCGLNGELDIAMVEIVTAVGCDRDR
jgi:hypothetical protein